MFDIIVKTFNGDLKTSLNFYLVASGARRGCRLDTINHDDLARNIDVLSVLRSSLKF